MPDAGYEEEQAADGAINGSVASDATNESAAATASAASTFMRIPELRQRLFSMMSFPELAVMFRVSAGLASDVARSYYAEVDFRDLEKRMSQDTVRSTTEDYLRHTSQRCAEYTAKERHLSSRSQTCCARRRVCDFQHGSGGKRYGLDRIGPPHQPASVRKITSSRHAARPSQMSECPATDLAEHTFDHQSR